MSGFRSLGENEEVEFVAEKTPKGFCFNPEITPKKLDRFIVIFGILMFPK